MMKSEKLLWAMAISAAPVGKASSAGEVVMVVVVVAAVMVRTERESS